MYKKLKLREEKIKDKNEKIIQAPAVNFYNLLQIINSFRKLPCSSYTAYFLLLLLK
jgi:hypothetical protein